MKKIFRFVKVVADMSIQIKGNSLKKLFFLYSIFSHYLMKSLGIKYVNFPELDIKLEGLIFKTRKNTLDFWMFWRGYENKTFSQLKKEIKPGDTFIDVGANIGRFSAVMAKRKLQVYSFEPIKSNFSLLNKNIRKNKLNRFVKAYNLALGNKKQNSKISYIPHKHGEASIILDFKGGLKEEIKVDKFDNLKISPRNNCFMKIDVEGFEYNVLLGASKFIKKYGPKIIIEIWNENTKEYLKELGYEQIGEMWYPK